MKKPRQNRFLKLAGMTASIATKTVATGIKNISADSELKDQNKAELLKEVGLQIADTLGNMKGAVMKVGQVVAQYKDIFPPEVSHALEKLQKDAPSLPFSDIKPHIEQELKQPISAVFSHFEERAFAAASIGQVHKATLKTGEQVVVKVQYPNVDESCDNDLKQVKLALKLTGLLKVDKQTQNDIFSEIKNSLYDELDYTKEAHNLKVFSAFHAKDENLIIPKVYEEFSSKRLLTLSYEAGYSLQEASTWEDNVKTKMAHTLFNMSASQIFFLRKIHCDPHAGNFAFREDGKVVVYDFGCTRTYSEADIAIFKKLVLSAKTSNINELEDCLRQLSIRNNDDQQIPESFYQPWMDMVNPPLFADETYDFGQGDVHLKVMEQLKKSMKYWDCFKPSAKTMMLDRTISGIYWNIVNLNAKANFSVDVDKYLIS